MATIDVIIVVDVQAALSSGNLNNIGGSVYMIDTNKYNGSGNEGDDELHTACNDGDMINWHVATVNPGNDASIKSFTGTMINDKICVPAHLGGSPDQWQGSVQARGAKTSYQYSVVLNLGDGAQGTFDPFLYTNGYTG